jgi:hypothetical protein
MRRSLRFRLIVGAILWTAGIAVVVNHVSLVVIHRWSLPMAVLHYGLMSLMGVGVLAAALWQVGLGLSPLHQLRALADVRGGREPRVVGDYPSGGAAAGRRPSTRCCRIVRSGSVGR